MRGGSVGLGGAPRACFGAIRGSGVLGGSWGAKTGGRHRAYWRAAALEWIDGYKEARYLATACEILRFAAAETCG